MVCQTNKKFLKISVGIIVMLFAMAALIKGIYSAYDYHYALDVVKDVAQNSNTDLQITEKIAKNENGDYDTKKLNYEVELKNIAKGEKVETQVAILLDTSYSMSTNDATGLAIQSAKSLATGILDNVAYSRVSISNNAKNVLAMTNYNENKVTTKNNVTNAINGIAKGNGNDLNNGIQFAESSFVQPINSEYTVNKYIIIFTDATDDTRFKVINVEKPITVIPVLVDMTSDGFVQNNKYVRESGQIYMLLNDTQESEIPVYTNKYSDQSIYDEMNKKITNIKVSNIFNEDILNNFTISNYQTTNGEIETTDNGYNWKVSELNSQETAKMTFTLELKTTKEIDVKYIFSNIYTNEEQNIEYKTNGSSDISTLKGTDKRDDTESTTIMICQAYDLKIRAVNESNKNVGVSKMDATIKIEELDDAGNVIGTAVVLNKTTDENGYIKITAEDTSLIRKPTKIQYTVTPNVNQVGYTNTDTVQFSINNDKITRTLKCDNYASKLEFGTAQLSERIVNVTLPINTQKSDFEIRVEEFGNSATTLANCEFELIQPKLNSTYEMEVLHGTTDATGTLHFNPTVMTKDGSYNYILVQKTTQTNYELTDITLITVEYKDAKITKVSRQFNDKVSVKKCDDENHVLVTVQNNSTNEIKPFKLNINLKDADDSTPLSGVSYLITTINSKNQAKNTYYVTDDNGKISADIQATGNIIIEITEQTPKAGYEADSTRKTITLNRNNNELTIWRDDNNIKPTLSADKTGIEIDFTSKKKSERNIINLSLVDGSENDVPIGKNVVYTLKDTETNEEIKGVSDNSGKIEFVINNKAKGSHRYALQLDKTTLPEEYKIPTVEDNISLDLVFDEKGFIEDGTAIATNIIKQAYDQTSDDKSTNHTYNIDLGFDMNSTNTYNFVIQLSDKENTATYLEGATYDITVEWDIGSVTKTREIKGRKTNVDGQIVTQIVKGDETRVYVRETAASIGYKCDNTTQEAVIKIGTTGIVKISQTPYDRGATNTDEPYNGIVFEGGQFKYFHANSKRSTEDTYLNLTVNKIDRDGAYGVNMPVLIKSNTLKNKKDQVLEKVQKTDENGTITFDYATYVNNKTVEDYIRAEGIGEKNTEVYYDLQISDLVVDASGIYELDGIKYSIKDGTTVKLRLIFRYKDGEVLLTNAETIYGNRLVKNKTYSSSKDDLTTAEQQNQLGVYLGNVVLDLYYNYDSVGNLGLDFKKQDKNGNELTGAKYEVKVTNTDGTITRNTFEIKNGSNSEDIEMQGLFVSKGSIIEIIEKTAPVGFEINTETERLEVSEVAADGELTLKQINAGYAISRISFDKITEISTDGTLKTIYTIKLTDYEISSSIGDFKVELTAKDKTTLNGIKDFEFQVDSSNGYTNKYITTGSDGKGDTIVGGLPDDGTSSITYSIKVIKSADYYERLENPINVVVYFDLSGHVDVAKTLGTGGVGGQTDPNYGTLWTIDPTSLNNKGIGIEILFTHLNPFTVKVVTIDSITNARVASAKYNIPESVTDATGNDNISVGYLLETGTKNYTLNTVSIANSYQATSVKTFRLNFTNKTIDNATFISSQANDTIQITANNEITITTYVEPKTPFELANTYYFDHSIALQGANFEIMAMDTNENNAGQTNTSGKTAIYTRALGTNQEIIYKVKQTLGATNYATVDDFYIKVSYDSNRTITSAILCDEYGTEITNNKFVTVGVINSSSIATDNGNGKGIVQINVLSYPEFKINITNVDRRDSVTKIVGTKYDITSEYISSTGERIDFIGTSDVETDSNGLGIAKLDRTKAGTVVTYTLKETTPATGYQSLGTEIKLEVTFDDNGYVSKVNVINDENLNKIEHAEKVATITRPEDNFVINMELKNNPILKLNITAMDSSDRTTLINGLSFKAIGKDANDNVCTNSASTNRVNQSSTPEVSAQTGTLGVTGYTNLYFDKTLDNQDVYYSITQVTKSAGYEWNDSTIIIKATYDSNGKISSVIPTQGGEFTTIVSTDAENFEININIYNDEIKAFGIKLTVEDTYNSEHKIDGLDVEAYLTKSSTTVADDKYQLTGNNTLLSGADRDGDGLPDKNHGEDYKTIGKYTEGSSTRTLVLNVKNNVSNKGYYVDSNNNTLGHYIGKTYYSDAKYQQIMYNIAISVGFDDEGKVTGASLKTGLDSYFGWLVDNSYVEVKKTGNYIVDIKIKLYPMFELSVNGMNNYTYEDEINKNKVPTALSGGEFLLSTTRHDMYTQYDEYVQAGYIGNGNNYGYSGTHVVYGNIYEDKGTVCFPIEPGKERLIYVFENAEPTNYQRHTKNLIPRYYERMIAIIKVTFNEKGEVVYEQSISRNQAGVEIKPYMSEDGSQYLSSNNIKEYNYYYDKEASNRNINFFIGYGLTTTIKVKAVDDISGSPISHIYIEPFVGGTYNTSSDYYYRPGLQTYTSSSGEFSMKYWGATEAGMSEQFILGSSRVSDDYNGYFLPEDLAKTSIGGSGNRLDYYVKLDVIYGKDGKIQSVKSVGKDVWGDDNTRNITWNSETGEINLEMLYSRKFQMTLNKVDYYDQTINNLVAKFNLISDAGLKTTINSSEKQTYMTTAGKVYKDKTVKYTLAETQIPNGYYPLEDTVEYYVTFDENGNISKNKIKSDSDYFKIINIENKTENSNKKKSDLTIAILNKPAFNLNLQVVDKFYNGVPLKDVYLEAKNSENVEASGSLQTDSNGYAIAIVGPVYPGKTIEYKIKQKNTIAGYYENDTEIVLSVKFNDAGKIEDYKIKSGNEVVNNFNPTGYKGTRTISIQITNMPKTVKLGVYKYDKVTNQAIPGVKFTITKTDKMNGSVIGTDTITTGDRGTSILDIDTFDKTSAGRKIKYTIHEDTVPQTYRNIRDIEYEVEYDISGRILSYNTSNVPRAANISIKTSGTPITFEENKVHMLAEISNDNAFDIIIKNYDSENNGIGIEGSKFKVSVSSVTDGNALTYETSDTDEKGTTSIEDITLSGKLLLKIEQENVGDGYKEDRTNITSILLDKSTEVYNIELNTETEGYISGTDAKTSKATIIVNSNEGTVTVTFENHQKATIKMIKQDITSKAVLKDVEFKITKTMVDSTGAAIGSEIELANTKTDENGQIFIELDSVPKSETWKYTFTEINPPEGYGPISPVSMTVNYDQYGNIQGTPTSSKTSRLHVGTEHGAVQRGNDGSRYYTQICKDMYAIVYNGDITPTYTVKVVTEDSQTGNRINGSSIHMNIKELETGNSLTIIPGSESSMTNDSTAKTTNLGIDGKNYTDEEVKEKSIIVQEKGLVFIDNISYEGDVLIDVSQDGLANGYSYRNESGSTITDCQIKLNVKHVPHLDADPTVEFSVIDNDGMKISVDEVSKVITITMVNDPVVHMDIKNVEYGSEGKTTIMGINYDITAVIETATTENIDTGINITTPLSDSDGKISQNIGMPYAGKNVIYTLKQKTIDKYSKIDDIKVLVQYNSRGYIKYYEVLSSQDNTSIVIEETSDRNISLIVQNKKEIGNYAVYIEKRAMDTDEEKYAYEKKLPGAKYKITVNQEDNGIGHTEWTVVTDEKGMAGGLTFGGYGYITITIEELEAPEGYQKDPTKTIRVYRNQYTGNFEEIYSDVNFDKDTDLNDDGVKDILLRPIDEQEEGKFTLAINKVDKQTQASIKDESAKFTVTIKQEDTEGEILYKNEIQNIYTNSNGKAIIDNIDLPKEAGKYKVLIEEVEAPRGYAKLDKVLEFNLIIAKDTNGNSIISQFYMDETNENVEYPTPKKQNISVKISNEKGYDISKTQYSLDITKVDNETENPITEDQAIFKLTYADGTYEYVETSTVDGKIQMPKFKMPSSDEFTETITHTYQLEEVKAPEGYLVDNTPMIIEVLFEKNTEDKVVIKSTTITKGDKTEVINQNDSTSSLVSTLSEESSGETLEEIKARVISFNIKNQKGKIINDEDRGKYNINILKIDEETNDPISSRATFKITLENGESVTASTDDRGKMVIQDIKIPANVDSNPGPYTYIIEEIKAPEGYETMSGYATMEVTFKQKIDSTTGLSTKYYEIDTATITSGDKASIESGGVTGSDVFITIKNKAKEEEAIYLKSEKYIIANETNYTTKEKSNEYVSGDKYIFGILPKGNIAANPGTTVEQFIRNIDTNADNIKITDTTGAELTNDSLIGTGANIILTKGTQTIEIKAIVCGDADGNGKLTGKDSSIASLYISYDDDTALDTIEKKLALDANLDGNIRPSDLAKIVTALTFDDFSGMGIKRTR